MDDLQRIAISLGNLQEKKILDIWPSREITWIVSSATLETALKVVYSFIHSSNNNRLGESVVLVVDLEASKSDLLLMNCLFFSFPFQNNRPQGNETT